MRSGVAPPTSHQNAMVNLFLKTMKEGRDCKKIASARICFTKWTHRDLNPDKLCARNGLVALY